LFLFNMFGAPISSIECTFIGAPISSIECTFVEAILVYRMYIVLVVARSPVERCHGVSDNGGVPCIFYVQKLIKVVDDDVKCMVMSHM